MYYPTETDFDHLPKIPHNKTYDAGSPKFADLTAPNLQEKVYQIFVERKFKDKAILFR